MPLPSGIRLGPYEIVGSLGTGGMAEVYRARDSRLERTVAIKILPSHFCSDPTRIQRLEREAKTISNLNHPNICVLYDVGHQDGIDFLVMECIEGETLAKRLEKGPLPLEQVLQYGAQIAGALDKAHSTGVVHRDLKPANIMLTKSGAKLLDFGLAKPIEPASLTTLTLPPAGLKASPGDRQDLTQEGALLGTLPYMSPERLEGENADARSDIFALGAILYEMSTGKRAFEGKTMSSVIAAILEREPVAPSQVQPTSPLMVDRLVKQCLAKDPAERMQSAHDVKLQLESIREVGVEARTETARSVWRTAAWVIGGLCLGVALAFSVSVTGRTSLPEPMARLLLLPPRATSFKQYNFAVSPDGTRLAFVATGPDGQDTIWIRMLSGANAQPIEGTKGAIYPFWSPDSLSVGFFAEGKLKVLDTSSGTVRVLCDALEGRGGTWNREGTIVFAPNISGPLYRIGVGGGSAAPVTKVVRPISGQAHRWPWFLPDDKHFLYFVDWSAPDDPEKNGIYAGSVEGEKPKLISSELAGNVAFSHGNLLYVRDRSLLAQRFDAGRLEFTGPLTSVVQQEVATDVAFSQSGFSVSQAGVLVFQSTTDTVSQLEWFDSGGKELAQLAETGYGEPRVSPDGRLVAFDSDDDRNGKSYIRVYDIARGISTRLTAEGNEMNAAWSADGNRIAYETGFRAGTSIYEVPADGSGAPKLLLSGAKMAHIDWSRDGQLLFSSWAKGLPLLDFYSFPDKRVTETGVHGAEGRLSPNGKWVACVGLGEGVYVLPFPGTGRHLQISHGDAAQPVWSRDGRKLFFISPDKTMMVVTFDPETGTAGAPQKIFNTRIVAKNFAGTQYDVAPDGRFLIHSLPADYGSPLTVLTNWPKR